MNSATIITPNYVRLDRTLASLGDRFLARLVDCCVVAGYETAMVCFLNGVVWENFSGDFVDFVCWVFILIPILFYSLICEYFLSGRTLGKMVMRTRVTMADGSAPTFGALVMRWMFEPIDIWTGFLGLGVMAFSPSRQRLGDLCAGTLVTKGGVSRQALLSLDHYDYVRRDYVPVYPEAQALSLGQAGVIDRVLYGSALQSDEKVAELARKVAGVIDVRPREASNTAFLQAVLKDYRYFMMQLV